MNLILRKTTNNEKILLKFILQVIVAYSFKHSFQSVPKYKPGNTRGYLENFKNNCHKKVNY